MTNPTVQLCLCLAPNLASSHPDLVRFGLHGQAKICVEVQRLARNTLYMQALEQRRQEHKHLQAGKSIAQATALSHPKDHHLLREVLVQLPVLIEEPLWPEGVWITPDFTVNTTVKITQYAYLFHSLPYTLIQIYGESSKNRSISVTYLS